MSTMAQYAEVSPEALEELGWLLDQRSGYWVAVNPILRIMSENCATQKDAEKAACLIQQAYGNGECNEQLIEHANSDDALHDLVIDSRKYRQPEDSGVEYWTVANKSGVVQLMILPLDDIGYYEWVEPTLKGPITKSVKSYSDYARTFPRHTHIKLRRQEGMIDWIFDGCCSLDLCRPVGQGAKQVEGFDPPPEPEQSSQDDGQIRTKRVVDSELEAAGWVLVLRDEGWFAENTVTGQKGTWAHPKPEDAEAEAAKIQWGPADIEAENPVLASSDPDLLDEALVYVLTWRNDWTARWKALAKRGATDDEIKEHAINVMGKGSATTKKFTVATNVVREQPRFYLGTMDTSGEPTLEGEALIVAIRRVMSIPDVEQGSESEFELVAENAAEPVRSSALESLDVRMIPLVLIEPDPNQPREYFDDAQMLELVASVKRYGVRTPIEVRFISEGSEHFRIISGERRFRASKLAGLEEIPARVVSATDEEIAELQLIENLHRVDLSPIEKAKALEKLLAKSTVKDLINRLGMSKTMIYAWVRLLKLPPRAIDALNKKEISVSTAELIARMPNAELRDKFAAEVLDGDLSYDAAKELVNARYMVQLSTAPFPQGSETLLPEAGSCLACPKMAGNNRDLFPEARHDICTDTVCYAKKVTLFRSLQDSEAQQHSVEERRKIGDNLDLFEKAESQRTPPAPLPPVDPLPTYSPTEAEDEEIEPDHEAEDTEEGADVPDYIASEELESQPERAAIAENKPASATAETAKPAQAAPCDSFVATGGFPKTLEGVPVHVNIAIHPQRPGQSTRSTVIGIRQHPEQMGATMIVINAGSIRDIAAEVEKAILSFVPSAKPVPLRPSADGTVGKTSAPAKPASKAATPAKKPASKSKAAPAKPAAKSKSKTPAKKSDRK